MVFYRKYRPQTISELDLEAVRNKLSSILAGSEIPHAFLFSGPKGLGKTSAARIVAKAINCEKHVASRKSQVAEKKATSDKRSANSQTIEPCNACSACTSITNGSNIDVLEIDAASNRGIDEIRDLRERIKFAPASLSKKIYIIDEVHMLTAEAFNALLKTLEEPPSHAIFILCTTEPWRLPETIVSRTFTIAFEKPTAEEVMRSLSRMVEGEGLQIEPTALEQIYALSEGSFRDASKILEELCRVGGGKITVETFEALYKTGSIENEVKKMISALLARNAKEALSSIDRLVALGIDMRRVNEGIVEHLRELLLKTIGVGKDVGGTTSPDIATLEQLISLFNEAYVGIKSSVLPQLPLELAVIQWCVLDTEHQENLKLKIKNKQSFLSDKQSLRFSASPAILKQSLGSKDPEKLEEKEGSVDKRLDLQEKKPAKKLDLAKKSDDFLRRLIDEVKKDNHSIAGVLRGCKVVEIGKNEVQIATNYKFHKDKLSDGKNLGILEKRAGEILGRKVVVKCLIR